MKYHLKNKNTQYYGVSNETLNSFCTSHSYNFFFSNRFYLFISSGPFFTKMKYRKIFVLKYSCVFLFFNRLIDIFFKISHLRILFLIPYFRFFFLVLFFSIFIFVAVIILDGSFMIQMIYYAPKAISTQFAHIISPTNWPANQKGKSQKISKKMKQNIILFILLSRWKKTYWCKTPVCFDLFCLSLHCLIYLFVTVMTRTLGALPIFFYNIDYIFNKICLIHRRGQWVG